AAPVWLRLVRSGRSVTGSYAEESNGIRGEWHSIGFDSQFTPTPTLKAGLAVTSFVDAVPTPPGGGKGGGSLETGGERTRQPTPRPSLGGGAAPPCPLRHFPLGGGNSPPRRPFPPSRT